MSETVYDVDYFIRKFEAIPANLWRRGGCSPDLNGRRCALGHCGCNGLMANFDDYNPEAKAFIMLFGNGDDLLATKVNDDGYSKSPQTDVLAALRELKSKQEQKV